MKDLPKFDDLMLPILNIFKDGKEHSRSEIKNIIYSNYTTEQLALQIPSGKRGVIADRLSWAIYYLREANVIKTVNRGLYIIGDNGKKLLNDKIDKISVRILKQFPEFIESRKKEKNSSEIKKERKEETQTPTEAISNIIEEYHFNMKNEILKNILNKDFYFFEDLVLKLLESMGYGKTEKTPKTHDNGFDGIVYQDRLGVERIYTQAKRYKENNIVQAPEMDKFIGVLHQSCTRSNKGIFITTSDFSSGARERAIADSTVNIVLLNGEDLIDLMIEYNIGVKTMDSYELKTIDEEFFE